MAPQFFVDHKRGEVNDLQSLLQNPKIIKDPLKMREVIKKVIAYMTLGIDVSKIFREMVMACNTKDLVQKKMVYHYLCSYARQKADMAILAISSLQNDCRDADPMVRGLALRSLCSLRVDNITEYVIQPIRKGLGDASPYVRKTAVVGIAKLFLFAPESVKDSDLVDVLYNMLKDSDTDVITNTINVLNEVLASEGKMAFNSQIILYLINRLPQFNEWGMCVVIDLLSRYEPQNDAEMFDIMNLLEPRLKHSNSAVVLGTTKVFLQFTKGKGAVHQQVFERLKAPLLTLMAGGSVELAFTVLSHIDVLVQHAPDVFADKYKSFFCRYNDPICVKDLKLGVLTALATEHSMADIIAELSEYVTDVDAGIARKAIKGIGTIAIKLPAAVDEAIEQLLGFLDLNIDYVSAEAVIVVKDLLRAYPDRYEEVLPAMQKCLKSVDEEEGKAAVIWMIGEYGDTIDDAPYILEDLVDALDDEPSNAVRNQLLSAAMKLFFKRPPEMQKMLGRLLKACIEDTSKVDVRDRALLYYRLLSLDVHEAARVVNCPKAVVDSFVDAEDEELRKAIFAEFNLLSVIYGMPEERFAKYVPQKDEDEGDEEEAEEEDATPAHSPSQSTDYSAPGGAETNVLDMSGGGSAAVISLTLMPKPVVDAKTFQANWGGLKNEVSVPLQLRQWVQKDVETLMATASVLCMASGTVATTMKFYFFAREQGTSSLFLVEAVVNTTNGQMQCKIKAQDASKLPAFQQVFISALASIC